VKWGVVVERRNLLSAERVPGRRPQPSRFFCWRWTDAFVSLLRIFSAVRSPWYRGIKQGLVLLGEEPCCAGLSCFFGVPIHRADYVSETARLFLSPSHVDSGSTWKSPRHRDMRARARHDLTENQSAAVNVHGTVYEGIYVYRWPAVYQGARTSLSLAGLRLARFTRCRRVRSLSWPHVYTCQSTGYFCKASPENPA